MIETSTVQIQKHRIHELAQVLRTTKFKQIRNTTSDQKDGRCALGVLAEHLGILADPYRIDRIVGSPTDRKLSANLTYLNDIKDYSFNDIADWMDSL